MVNLSVNIFLANRSKGKLIYSFTETYLYISYRVIHMYLYSKIRSMFGVLIKLLTFPVSTIKIGIWWIDGLRKCLVLFKVSDQR